MTHPHESAYPYDSRNKLSELRLYRGPDRLRWIPDRKLAQTLLDIWIAIEQRDAKRRQQNTQHWTEAAER